MPQTLPLPSPVAANARHCTSIYIAQPIEGEIRLTANFTLRETYADGSHWEAPEANVVLTHAEVAALPAFAAAYGQLAYALHAKRAAMDAPAPDDAPAPADA